MKTHARNTALGGIMLPIALLIATLIANEGQTLIGLELDRVALAIFLLPFLYGCAEVVKALLKFEAARIGNDLFGDLFGGGGAPEPGASNHTDHVHFSAASPWPGQQPPPPSATPTPPPPPAPPAVRKDGAP